MGSKGSKKDSAERSKVIETEEGHLSESSSAASATINAGEGHTEDPPVPPDANATIARCPLPRKDDRTYWGPANIDHNKCAAAVEEVLRSGEWANSPRQDQKAMMRPLTRAGAKYEGAYIQYSSNKLDPVARAEMIEQLGCPPMKVISAHKLQELGYIPRSDEGHAISIRRAVHETVKKFSALSSKPKSDYTYGPQVPMMTVVEQSGASHLLFDNMKIYFVSHRWLRPARDGTANPDDEKHSKCKTLIQFAKMQQSYANGAPTQVP